MSRNSILVRGLRPALAVLVLAAPAAAGVAVTLRNRSAAAVAVRRGLGCDPNPIEVRFPEAAPGTRPVWLCCPLMVPCPGAQCVGLFRLAAGGTAVLAFRNVDCDLGAALEVFFPDADAAGKAAARITYTVTTVPDPGEEEAIGSLVLEERDAGGPEVHLASNQEAELRCVTIGR